MKNNISSPVTINGFIILSMTANQHLSIFFMEEFSHLSFKF